MDTTNQISQNTFQRISEAYAEVCAERPSFIHRFTGWTKEGAGRLVESRRRLLSEFDDALDTSIDDLLGIEMAECYLAYESGDTDSARRSLCRAIAVLLRGDRMLMLEKLEKEALEAVGRKEDNDSNG